jgi:elongation factor P--(R)-beta-lysine ligase
MSDIAVPWWQPDRHADRRSFLVKRAAITRAVRDHFNGEGFLEVETAALQVSPGNETHLHGMPVTLRRMDGAPATLFLHTSPEFACKKLLAAGEQLIFTLARVFRDRERGPLHHPEFTMLEWYRAGADYTEIMDDCEAVLRVAATTAGRDDVTFAGRRCALAQPAERVSVVEAFARHAGIDLSAALLPVPDASHLANEARRIGLRVAEDDTWSDMFSRIMSDRIEPKLGIGRPTILMDYPASEAALARRKPGAPHLCERFELYVCGVELANAFGELTDASEQRERFEADMEERLRIYGDAYPLDDDFLNAVAAMPPASGAALGLDRLVMLATGARRLDDVIWTPVHDPFAGVWTRSLA